MNEIFKGPSKNEVKTRKSKHINTYNEEITLTASTLKIRASIIEEIFSNSYYDHNTLGKEMREAKYGLIIQGDYGEYKFESFNSLKDLNIAEDNILKDNEESIYKYVINGEAKDEI